MPKITIEMSEEQHDLYKTVLEFIAKGIVETAAKRGESHRNTLSQVKVAMTIQSMSSERLLTVPIRIGAAFCAFITRQSWKSARDLPEKPQPQL